MREIFRMNLRNNISVLLIALLVASCSKHEAPVQRFAKVERGPAQVWTTYEGQLEARVIRDIMSNLGGSAAIVELAPEGAVVKPGDLLVRLDSTQFERDLLRLERDCTLALADLSSLTNAKLPLEIRELESRLLVARGEEESERRALADTEQLVKEGLLSDLETKKQHMKVATAESKVRQFEETVALTKNHLHPAAIEAAAARVASTEQELRLGREQISNCTIRAPAAGYVVHKPLHVGGEFRNVRVGDSVFKNQPFMSLPDLGDLVVSIYVPEAELALVRTGMNVVVGPSAFPDIRLDGVVEAVGSMAQNKPGFPAWQKFFRITIGLKQGGSDLRTGMSVSAQVLSFDRKEAVLVPRLAVRWEQGIATCEVRKNGKIARQVIKLAAATERYFVANDGVEVDDEVLLP